MLYLTHQRKILQKSNHDMKIRTELLYGSVISASVIVVGVFFFQLLSKYTFVNFSQPHNVCSPMAFEMNYTSFDMIGKSLGTIILALACALLFKILFSVVKTHQKNSHFQYKNSSLSFAKLTRICSQHSIDEKNIVIVKNKKMIALTFGIRNPKIVLSSGLIRTLKKRELEAVLLHEQYHLRHKHPVLFFCGELASSSLSFLPILKDIFEHFKKRLEKEADAFACSIQKTSVHVEHALQTVQISYTGSFYPAFSTSVYESRIESLHGSSETFSFSKKNLFSSLSTVLFFIILVSLPVSVKAQEQPGSNGLVNCSDSSHSSCGTYCQPGLFSFSKQEYVSREISLNSSGEFSR